MALADFAEKSWIPDSVLRQGIRYLSKKRLEQELSGHPELAERRYQALLKELKASDIAVHTDAANEQHYELPAVFFERVLGENRKYSGCFFKSVNDSLSTAEGQALATSCERAQLQDGHAILELGCGWGSLTLWMAKHYPNANITAVSNSNSQRQYINNKLQAENLHNVTVITCDANELSLDQNQFDRVVSIEMFEHMRNYQKLFSKISAWLKPDGKLWCHVFCHRHVMYKFEALNENDWMSKYFFTGGIMPAFDTFLSFQESLSIDDRWYWSGTHYEKTANAWLNNMDANKQELQAVFKDVYKSDADLWWQRWRIFFMACAELFGYKNGNEWGVGHYLFSNKK